MQDIFTKIYETNYWSGRQSRSGTGSDLEETKNIRRELPRVFFKYDIKYLLDIPCGDINWISELRIDSRYYMGADIVPEMIEINQKKYPQYRFEVLDITKDFLPRPDAILTRDCFGHLSNPNVHKAVENIKVTKPKYLIATHWPKAINKTIPDGSWRPINMEYFLDDDFRLVELIEEDVEGKYLGVWAYEPR